jgi:SHS2 domain-containing protein
MEKYKFLEHTADEKFQAYGKTLEEAFANAALATMAIMTEDKIKSTKEESFQIEAKSKEQILYSFLEHLLFLIDTESYLVSEVTSIKLKGEEGKYTLEVTTKGDSAESYEILAHIKAVTYHEMFIKEGENKVTVQVVLDL